MKYFIKIVQRLNNFKKIFHFYIDFTFANNYIYKFKSKSCFSLEPKFLFVITTIKNGGFLYRFGQDSMLLMTDKQKKTDALQSASDSVILYGDVFLGEIKMKVILAQYKKYQEIINYLIVGGLTTVVSLSVYYGLVLTVLDPEQSVELQIANILSWIGAVTFAYFTNRKYVFRSENRNMLKEAGLFYSSRISTLLMDMVIMFFMVTLFHINDKIAKLVVQVVVTIANYIFSKLFVFKKK